MRFRNASMNDLHQLVELEALCFPPAEAADIYAFKDRLQTFPNHFWVLEENGKIISMINGCCSEKPVISDEMFADASLHQEEGGWQMIFGLMTHPDYRHNGYASILLNKVIEKCKAQDRKGVVLTCKTELIGFYKRLGFVHEGFSLSKHGGAKWNDMRVTFFDLWT